MKIGTKPFTRVSAGAQGARDVTGIPAARLVGPEGGAAATFASGAGHGGVAGGGAATVSTTTGEPPEQAGGIARVFAGVVGPAQIAALKASLSDKPVVLIAGDQLTGKSTAAKAVADALGGAASGTGRLVRAAAEEAGVPVEAYVKTVPASFDVELDWRAAKQIGRGEVAVFESRLAGHLGKMLAGMGRKNIVSVYLVASPRERALRYLNRELSPQVRARIDEELAIQPGATLEEAMAAVVALGDPDLSTLAARMKDIAHRDDVDHARLEKLYGVDYQDRSAFDVVIVTDGKTPEQVQAEVLAAVSAGEQ